MAEYIERGVMLADANLILDRLKDIEKSKNKAKIEGARIAAIASLVGIMKETPAEDVVPVVHGRWIRTVLGDSIENHCSVCNAETPWFFGYGYYEPDYCPSCGAKMVEAR